MDGDPRSPVFGFCPTALGLLMPMHLHIDAGCRILGAGPTLAKLIGPAAAGSGLDAIFTLHRPRLARSAADLVQVPRLRLSLRSRPGTAFKGLAVPLCGGGEALVNLSFGWAVRDAVRDHALSDTDFAPTDLAIELLYLAEARAAVMGELDKVNRRLRGAKQQAEAQALSDPLTGLGNRRAMERELALLIGARAGFALVHLDLDFFKQVNDSLGHAAGDHVLCEVARILRDEVREGDLVARVGGDEFVLLLPGLSDPGPLARLCGAILSRVAQPISYQGQACRVAASIGATVADPRTWPDAGQLMAAADRALYASKEGGRHRMTLMTPGGVPLSLAIP